MAILRRGFDSFQQANPRLDDGSMHYNPTPTTMGKKQDKRETPKGTTLKRKVT
jgi:hypothetical protein